MTNKDNSAYPSMLAMEEVDPKCDARNGLTGGGLTKRELFAAMAMQGLIHEPPINLKRIAELSVEASDCLIDALNAKP